MRGTRYLGKRPKRSSRARFDFEGIQQGRHRVGSLANDGGEYG